MNSNAIEYLFILFNEKTKDDSSGDGSHALRKKPRSHCKWTFQGKLKDSKAFTFPSALPLPAMNQNVIKET